ncbi:MAG: PQQ-binding-like beta-propeller repeat protein [Chloracidobacterium sp.]
MMHSHRAWRWLCCAALLLVVGSALVHAQQRPRLTTILNGRATVPLQPLSTVWLYLEADGARQEPLVTERAVYVPLRSGKVVALARQDGARLWETSPGVALTANLYRLGNRLVACASRPAADGVGAMGIVRWLDLETGVVQREITLSSPITSNLVSDGARLYARLGEKAIVALDPDTFSITWQVDGDFTEALACDRDLVVVSTPSGELWSLRAVDGSRQWRCFLGARPGPATGDDKWVYCGTERGEVVAIQRTTGRIQWRRRTGGAITAPPLVYSNWVLVASYDNFLYALDGQTGELRWRQQMAGRLTRQPTWLTDATFAVAALDDREITIVNSSDGRVVARWRLDTERVFSALHISNGLVVMGTERGIAAVKL